MPREIKLTKLPAGYAENSGRAGDKLIVSLRGFFSSEDGNELIVRLEGFPQEVVNGWDWESVWTNKSSVDMIEQAIIANQKQTGYN